jgi:AcrR family transcriptional regulator
MPTPSRTSLEAIVAAGRTALRDGGLDALTMQRVAELVGVRAASLYKRVPSRAGLVRLVVEDVFDDLGSRLDAAATTGDPAIDLRALGGVLREFAHEDRYGFDLLFSPLPQDASPDPARFEAASAPILRVATALAGSEHALPAARTVTAWAAGFLRMELAGDFHLGGDVAEAFDFGIRTLLAGIREVGSIPGD